MKHGKLHCVCVRASVSECVFVCVCEQMDRFKQGCMLLGQMMPLGMLKQADKEK